MTTEPRLPPAPHVRPSAMTVSLLLAWLLAAPPAAVLPGTVFLRAGAEGSGAGFVVDAGNRLILTCRHVVGDRKEVELFFPFFERQELRNDRAWYFEHREKLAETRHLVRGRVLRTSDDLDLALIEAADWPAHTQALTLNESGIALGEPVGCLGHRGDVETLWNLTSGTVRQTGRLGDGYPWEAKKLGVLAPGLVLQLPIERGDSGGPIWNARGEIVGIVSAHKANTPMITLGISAAGIRTFLHAADPPARKPPATLAERVAQATVWVSPSSTAGRRAGVLLDSGRRWVATSASGLKSGERISVAFAHRDGHRILGERTFYTDSVDLHLAGLWHPGTVIALAGHRDLAMIELDSLPAGRIPLALAAEKPGVGSEVHHISHPKGLEFVFLYSRGTIRGYGSAALERDRPRVPCQLLQLPAQAESSGGPIVNDQGKLIGVLASRETPTQQFAYAAELNELRDFVSECEKSLLRRPLLEFWTFLTHGKPTAKFGSYAVACLHFQAGEHREALAWLDSAITPGTHPRLGLLLRSECYSHLNDPKKAIAEIHRWLDLHPGDAVARLKLARYEAEAGDEEKSAADYFNTLRLNPGLLSDTARQIDAHARRVAKFGTDRANDWMIRVLQKLLPVLPSDEARKAAASALRQCRAAEQKLTDEHKNRILHETLRPWQR